MTVMTPPPPPPTTHRQQRPQPPQRPQRGGCRLVIAAAVAAVAAAAATLPAAVLATTKTPPTGTVPTIPGATYQGCFVDDTTANSRALPLGSGNGATNEACIAACSDKGFPIAGTEYGGECYCGANLNGIAKASESECNKDCEANTAEICGGSKRLTVFKNDTIDTFVPKVPIIACTTYYGCWVDTVNPRTFPVFQNSNSTDYDCVARCQAKGFTFAGTENFSQCFCSNSAPNTTQVDDSICRLPCEGDRYEVCGGRALMTVYEATGCIPPTNTITPTVTPTDTPTVSTPTTDIPPVSTPTSASSDVPPTSTQVPPTSTASSDVPPTSTASSEVLPSTGTSELPPTSTVSSDVPPTSTGTSEVPPTSTASSSSASTASSSPATSEVPPTSTASSIPPTSTATSVPPTSTQSSVAPPTSTASTASSTPSSVAPPTSTDSSPVPPTSTVPTTTSVVPSTLTSQSSVSSSKSASSSSPSSSPCPTTTSSSKVTTSTASSSSPKSTATTSTPCATTSTTKAPTTSTPCNTTTSSSKAASSTTTSKSTSTSTPCTTTSTPVSSIKPPTTTSPSKTTSTSTSKSSPTPTYSCPTKWNGYCHQGIKDMIGRCKSIYPSFDYLTFLNNYSAYNVSNTDAFFSAIKASGIPNISKAHSDDICKTFTGFDQDADIKGSLIDLLALLKNCDHVALNQWFYTYIKDILAQQFDFSEWLVEYAVWKDVKFWRAFTWYEQLVLWAKGISC